MDSYFLAPKAYLMSFFEEYERQIGLPFFAQFFPNQITRHPEILDAAMASGLHRTVIGIQSGGIDPSGSNVFKRKTVHEDITSLARLLGSYKELLIDYHLITHNPYESDDVYYQTLDLVGKLPKRNAQLVLNRLRYFSGTELDRQRKLNPVDMGDESLYHKRHLLLLTRFWTEDNVFERAQEQWSLLSFEQCMDYYETLPKRDIVEPDWMSQAVDIHHETIERPLTVSVLTNDICSRKTLNTIQSVKYNVKHQHLIVCDDARDTIRSFSSRINRVMEIVDTKYLGFVFDETVLKPEELSRMIDTLGDTYGIALVKNQKQARDSFWLLNMDRIGHLRMDNDFKESYAKLDLAFSVMEVGFKLLLVGDSLVDELGNAPSSVIDLSEDTRFVVKWFQSNRYSSIHPDIWRAVSRMDDLFSSVSTIKSVFSNVDRIEEKSLSSIVLSTLIAFNRGNIYRCLIREELRSAMIETHQLGDLNRSRLLQSILTLMETQWQRIESQNAEQVRDCKRNVVSLCKQLQEGHQPSL